tara:strand:- start:54 stop:545 length:492 start_codon:yes stop_codon:yes gene_type:complete
MPNWTDNTVSFKSRINSKKQLDKLKKRLKGCVPLINLPSGEKTIKWNDFDFNRIHKMPKDLEGTTSPTQKGDEKKAEQRLKKYGAKDWYAWNNKNWGTKWNSVDTEITVDDRLGLTYKFKTAWDCPREIVEKLEHILDEELPFISIESWECIHEDGQEFEQIV